MVKIQEAMRELIKEHKRFDIAETIGVSEAMVSTWLRAGNDFSPRFNIAKNIYKSYGIVIYPYAEEALNETL